MNTIDSLHMVARYFNGLDIPYTFLGASVLPLLVDNPAVQEIRPTMDIDLSVQVVTLTALYELEERLRGLGFRHDTTEGAPICRWLVEGVTVDVMPTEAAVFGMASAWFYEAVKTATKMDLGEGARASHYTTLFSGHQIDGLPGSWIHGSAHEQRLGRHRHLVRWMPRSRFSLR